MRNYFFSCITSCIITFCALHSQAQRLFPKLICDDVDFNKHEIPQELNGKNSLIGIAFSPKAEADMATWYQPLYENFHYKQENALFEASYDVNLVFIPTFTGLKKAGYKPFIKKVKKKVSKEIQPYILFYKANTRIKKLQKTLKFKNKKTCLIFVLDKRGVIVEQIEGAYHSRKMDKITDYLSVD